MTKETKAKVMKIAGIVGNVLLWAFVIFSVLVTALVFTAQGSKDGVPSLFGKGMITIQSPSMDPTYKIGDLVFLTKLTDEEKTELLEPGVIITYHAPIDIDGDGKIGDLNTHRIDSFNEHGKIVTKGDNPVTNPTVDGYTIGYGDVVGICTEGGKIGGIGNVMNFLRSSLGFFLCIVLPLILFFLYELYNFISIIVTERAKRVAADAPVSKETEDEIKKRAIEEYKKQLAEEAKAAAEAEANKDPEDKGSES